MRQEMIKLDDTNGQLRKECQKLKMELEQSVAENNLFGSLNSEMKKLMSSMLDYCKQHESDIKRYKRKHEEIEEDIRFSKAMPPMKIKCDKLLQLVRYREFQRRRLKEKEHSKEACKDKLLKMPPPKELRLKDSAKELNGRDIKEISDSKDLINAKELQHIKDILNNSKDISCKDLLHSKQSSFKEHSSLKHSASKHRDSFKDFLHPKDSSHIHGKDFVNQDFLHRDLVLRKDMHLSKSSYSKLAYSKEVLRSKELLKERYLRDCSKMKLKEIMKDKNKEESEKRPLDKDSTEYEPSAPEPSDELKVAPKEVTKDSAKITVSFNSNERTVGSCI